MNKYAVHLIGVNVTVAGQPMKPDETWTNAAKAAIEFSSGLADRADRSRMSVHELVEASVGTNEPKKVLLVYDREIITAKNLFEQLKQVDAEVELDILLRPLDGSLETEPAGLLSRCTFDLFTIEKMPEGPNGFLEVEFQRVSYGPAVQLFAKEVEANLQ